jgi:formiminoglutamase
MTLSGFSVEELRQFITFLSTQNATYLHICEGAPDLGEEKKQSFNRVIGYLITDFIKASAETIHLLILMLPQPVH